MKLLLENWRRFLNEEVVGNLVFGYTEMSPKDFENFKNQGFKLRAHRGPLGRGLYARYKYRGAGPASAEDPSYGSVIVKFKISLEDKIPILQYEDSKIAYPYYRLVDQLIKFGILSSNDVAAADKQLNQLHPEVLNQMIEWLHESSFVDPWAAQDQKDPTGPGAELIQDDKFKIVLLSRLVDALNSDIPKNAPYVSHMIKNLKGADEILSTDTVGQQLLKIRSFGTNVAGIMTYVGEGSIDGYVLFLNTPKLAIPISYYSFDEEGFKELGLQQGSADLDALRDVQRNEKRYRIMTKEGGDWVWNLGLGKEAVFGWLDIAGLVIDGKSTLEKLSGARIWDDKWPKMFGGGKRGGYISGPRGVPPAQRLGDMDGTWPILKQIIASGTKVIPKPVFKKFSKEAMRSWLKSASKRRKEMSPEQRAKEQSLPDIGWKSDLPTSAEIQARGLRPDPFYVSETKFIFENWRKYLIKEFGGEPAMTADEYRDYKIAASADHKALELTKHSRDILKREVGRVWGDDARSRREEEAKEKAVDSVIPKLMKELEGQARSDKIKYLVYILDNLQAGLYEPSEKEKAGVYGDPAEPGAPPPRRLSGTIPSLGIDLKDYPYKVEDV